MTSVTLRLVYDGLDATNHKMPTALEKKITTGAQEFLGAHAYFFTEGRVPPNVGDHSRHFQIHDIRKRDGCWEALFDIAILSMASDFFSQYRTELTKVVASKAAVATQSAFSDLIRKSYKKWLEGKPLTERTFDRVEPVLTFGSGNRESIFDNEVDCELQRRRLFERTNSSMSRITSPLGRSATHVDIWLDSNHLDQRQNKFTQDDVASALSIFRQTLENRNSI